MVLNKYLTNKKIYNAIKKANDHVKTQITENAIEDLTNLVVKKVLSLSGIPDVETIQDFVEEALFELHNNELTKNYIVYRFKKTQKRNNKDLFDKINSLVNSENEELREDNANKPLAGKHSHVDSSQSTVRDYIAGVTCKAISNNLIPDDIMKAHNEGIIHWHDMDYSPVMKEHNCCLIDLADMLDNGTMIGSTYIATPKSFKTACTVTSQIIACVASNQYGGNTISLSALAPYVNVSRKKIREEHDYLRKELGDELFNAFVEREVIKEVKDGVQTIQYQLLTLQNSNGQTPFCSVAMYLDEVEDKATKQDLALIIEEVLNQRIKGIQIEDGTWQTPIFPKLIYFLDEDNIEQNSEFYYLTELAIKCSAKRMCPDYVSVKVMKEQQRGHAFPSMGCRSQLTDFYPCEHPNFMTDEKRVITKMVNGEAREVEQVKCINGKWYDPKEPIYYGRFNMGVITLNLPYLALLARENNSKEKYRLSDFWKLLDEYMELIHKGLRIRYERLKGTTSNQAPIQWKYGALARLENNELIDKILVDGYATISVGYVGLFETVKALINKSNTDEEGSKLELEILTKIKEYCENWKESEPEHLAYSIYGTPEENCTYKFAKALQKRFGIVDGINNKSYVTNSYHINPAECIDAFSKLSKESIFQKVSSGGNISYVEIPDLTKNYEALYAIIKHIYNNNRYAEINTRMHYCKKCGYEGEITLMKTDNGKFEWKCPNCGNTDESTMYLPIRICGYISNASVGVSQGRLNDVADRVLHL